MHSKDVLLRCSGTRYRKHKTHFVVKRQELRKSYNRVKSRILQDQAKAEDTYYFARLCFDKRRMY